ncbi:MAG: hypothetical protein HYW48_09585 [Deltaproteobacteria bacterium]|nr:hypothetical protein [Deltaproteobacteria bacterium]
MSSLGKLKFCIFSTALFAQLAISCAEQKTALLKKERQSPTASEVQGTAEVIKAPSFFQLDNEEDKGAEEKNLQQNHVPIFLLD